MTAMDSSAPISGPKRDMNMAVVMAVLLTEQRFVPVSVVDRNHSGLSSSLNATDAEREPASAFCLTNVDIAGDEGDFSSGEQPFETQKYKDG